MVIAPGYLFAAATEAKTGTVSGVKISEHPDWFKESFLDIADDVDEAAEAGKHVMLFMHLNGCPYCFKTVEENIKNSPYTGFIKKNFDVIAINIQGDREIAFNEVETLKEKALAKMLNVRFTPTVIFLDSSNQQVLRLNGYRTRSAFKHALDFVKSKGYQQTTLVEYIATQKAAKRYQMREHPQLQAITNLQRVADKPLALLFEDKWCNEACNTLHDDILSQPETQKVLETSHLSALMRHQHNRLLMLMEIKRPPRPTRKNWASVIVPVLSCLIAAERFAGLMACFTASISRRVCVLWVKEPMKNMRIIRSNICVIVPRRCLRAGVISTSQNRVAD